MRTIWGKLRLDLYGRSFAPIDDKWDAIAPYGYSIAFENARSPHYFNEKIMDCFVSLTVPLYYGSPEIQKYFPAKSFIAIDPSDPRTIDKIRDIIASDLWKGREAAFQEAKWLVLYKYISAFATDAGNTADPADQARVLRLWLEHSSCRRRKTHSIPRR